MEGVYTGVKKIIDGDVEGGVEDITVAIVDVGLVLAPLKIPKIKLASLPKAKPAADPGAGPKLLDGSGPVSGVLEVSDRVKSVAAVKSFNPAGKRDFVWDPPTGRFATGADQGVQGHDGLRTAIGASEETVIGGNIISRGSDGKIVTDEWSGHYGHRWNDEVRKKFVEFMKGHGLDVDHRPWQ